MVCDGGFSAAEPNRFLRRFIGLNFYGIASNINLVCVSEGRKIPDNDIHSGYNDNLGNNNNKRREKKDEQMNWFESKP